MEAYVLDGPGEWDSFKLVERPIPASQADHVVILVKAFGLNRSEYFSRKGLSSPDFSFPRVLGLECVGEVIDGGGTDLVQGDRVMALMGRMGRSIDGSYATHTIVPRSQVFRLGEDQDWGTWGAIPETYNTAFGVCMESLRIDAGELVLIRGGTSALGMACSSIARDIGCTVISTTRNPNKLEPLKASGVHAVLDGDDLPRRIIKDFPGVSVVVENVGSKASIELSCACLPNGGQLGRVGELAESWGDSGKPSIPNNIKVSFTNSGLVASPKDDKRMETITQRVSEKRYQPNIYRAFSFIELPEAHRVMGTNDAVGKLVVVID